MTNDPQQSQLFTHIDVSTHAANADAGITDSGSLEEVGGLLKQLVIGQQKQNQILNELVQQLGAAQKQRASELGQWRDANPHLARQCRQAAEALSDVQTQFLRNLTEEITDNADGSLAASLRIRDKTTVQPQDYVNTGNEGLVGPGQFTVTLYQFDNGDGDFGAALGAAQLEPWLGESWG